MEKTFEDKSVNLPNGKVLKWTGASIAFGKSCEATLDAHFYSISVEVFETKAGKFIADIWDADNETQYIETATTLDSLVDELSVANYVLSDNHDFMSALAAAFPDRQVWVEEIA